MTTHSRATTRAPRRYRNPWLATLCVAALGCTGVRSEAPLPAAPAPSETAQALAEVRAALQARRAGVESLRGRGTLTVSSPDWEGASRLQAIVLARRPEDLRIRGYTPLSTAFDVLTDASDFRLHLPESAEAWIGPAQELGDATGLPLVPADLVSALFGLPFEVEDSLRLAHLERDFLIATWRVADGSQVEARFTRRPTLPESFRLRRDGRIRVELEYGDYLREPQGWWPRRYALTWPEEEAYFRLHLVAIELNPRFEPGSFELTPPAGTQWVPVRASGSARSTGGRP